jgi:hypothetical protein
MNREKLIDNILTAFMLLGFTTKKMMTNSILKLKRKRLKKLIAYCKAKRENA